MNSHLSLNPDDRLREWKSFRDSASEISDIREQLLSVQSFWEMKPFMTRSIDIDDPKSWPTPWELIHSGECCPLSKAYLIEQTLILMDSERYTSESLRLLYVEDRTISEAFMILVYDNKYVLNYQYKDIIEFDKVTTTCAILQEYIISTQYKHYIKK